MKDLNRKVASIP